MQEQTKRKRVSRLTARLGEKDPAGSRRRLMWLGRELLLGCAAYLLGLGRLAFDTRPLGLALLCASGGQTTGILGGLVFAELALWENPVPMLVVYAVAAVVRVTARLLMESPVTAVTLPDALPARPAGAGSRVLPRSCAQPLPTVSGCAAQRLPSVC